jgi:hypothetical protein
MTPRRGRPILPRMNADTFIFLALEAVAVLSVVALAWTLHRFAAPGPSLDRG